MMEFKEYRLSNGLQLIIHKDITSPIVAFNLLYKVGARNENEERTGFAHLFEHLMFGGSINIPSFDQPLQAVGGENNAFTSNDLTNYYITLPKECIETAFWLESDRMLGLAFTPKSLEVQRQVVIEEFKQRYLNQPYGDVYLLLRPLAYKKHPYQWATIGKDISHIENATMQEVKDFFYRYYRPNNAILSIVGDIEEEAIFQMTNKWFGEIPAGEELTNELPQEEQQTGSREMTVERDVPLDAIYKAYHMVDRLHDDYYATDLISDILSLGNSSRFYRRLVKEKQLFNDLDAYITADIDPGLFIISGRINQGVNIKDAELAIEEEIEELKAKSISDMELKKVKNKVETVQAFGKTSVLNKAMGLAIATFIDQPNLINRELGKYKSVDSISIQRVARKLFKKENSSTLYYLSKKEKG